MKQAHRMPWHVRRINGEQAALDALAWYADCSKPAHVVLLVDQVLQRSSAACPEKALVWVMSLVRFAAVLVSLPLNLSMQLQGNRERIAYCKNPPCMKKSTFWGSNYADDLRHSSCVAIVCCTV
jgi:hypothetical protein